MGECLKVERILARLGVGHDSGRTEAYDLLTTAFLGCKTGDLSGIGLEEEIADALKLLSAPDAQNIGHEWPGCGVVGSLAFALNGGWGWWPCSISAFRMKDGDLEVQVMFPAGYVPPYAQEAVDWTVQWQRPSAIRPFAASARDILPQITSTQATCEWFQHDLNVLLEEPSPSMTFLFQAVEFWEDVDAEWWVATGKQLMQPKGRRERYIERVCVVIESWLASVKPIEELKQLGKSEPMVSENEMDEEGAEEMESEEEEEEEEEVEEEPEPAPEPPKRVRRGEQIPVSKRSRAMESNPLILAVLDHDVKRVVKLIHMDNVIPNIEALVVAVHGKNDAIAQHLLSANSQLATCVIPPTNRLIELIGHPSGAPTWKEAEGWTILHFISYCGAANLVELVCKRAVEARDYRVQQAGARPEIALSACESNKEELNWATTRRDHQKRTPLHVACRFGQYSVIRVLLACGADPRSQCALKFSPMHWLISEEMTPSHIRCAEEVINYCADSNDDREVVNEVDGEGLSLLYWSAITRTEMAKRFARSILLRGAKYSDVDIVWLQRDLSLGVEKYPIPVEFEEDTPDHVIQEMLQRIQSLVYIKDSWLVPASTPCCSLSGIASIQPARPPGKEDQSPCSAVDAPPTSSSPHLSSTQPAATTPLRSGVYASLPRDMDYTDDTIVSFVRSFRGCSCQGKCLENASCTCVNGNSGTVPYEVYYDEDLDLEVVRLEFKSLGLSRSLIQECSDLCVPGRGAHVGLTYCQRGVAIPVKLVSYGITKGFGVVTQCPLVKGQFVCVYSSEILSNEGGEARELDRFKRVARDGTDELITYQVVTDKTCSSAVFDGTVFANVARFFNHSCDPNMKLIKVFRGSQPMIAFFCRRDVEEGEELTWNYDTSKRASKKNGIKCLCGAATCRGYL